jgi:Zn-dependent protease with chaperone function
MNKKLVGIFIFIVSCLFFKSHAQDLSDFTRLESKGEIPQDFLVLSSEKIKADQASNKNEELDEDFFISTRYGLDELLLSGQILFNEELSNYVNEVAKYTLRDEPELINELRFYIIKSNEVNAYSTDQGIIFFTTGLLAQLEYEAQ